MGTKKLFLLLGLAILWSGVSLGAQGQKVLKIAMDATWPPMEFLDDKKKLQGFDVDLMTEVCQILGLKPEFLVVSWDGIFDGLNRKKYDVIASGITVTEERQASLLLSKPYLNAGQVLVVAQNSPIKSLRHLKGARAAAQNGTSGLNFLENINEKKSLNLKFRRYEDAAPCFYDLEEGKVDAVVIDLPLAAQYVKLDPKFNGKFRIVGGPRTDEPYALTVQKDNKKLHQDLNKALDQLQAKGRIAALIKKWF